MADTPNIRFREFSDDWEQRKLGEITNVLSASRVHKDEWQTDGVPFFRSSDVVSAFKGQTNEKAFISYELYEELVKSSGKLGEGDLLITGGGSIGIPYIVPNNEPLYSKDADLIWIKKSSEFNSMYLYTYFTSPRFRNHIGSISHIGTIAHYTIEQVKDTPIMIPSVKEQVQIGVFFNSLNQLITFHQRKCDETKELKKYMLQKMFPQNGKKIPEIRFEGFTDAWEQRKIRYFMHEGIIEAPMDGNHGEKHPTASEYVSEGIPFLMASDIRNGKADIFHCKYITKGRANKLDKGFAKNGDILITHKATIGEVAILQGLNTEYAVLTPQVTYYRIQDEGRLNRKYLYAYFISEEFLNNLKTKAAQSTRPYIGISAQQNLAIYFPINVKEQEQIGEFFENLDRLITLHQRKCDQLKEVKKYMLQNMFPQKG